MREADGTALRDLTLASPLSRYLLQLKGKPPKKIAMKDSWALPVYRHLRSCLLVSVTWICCLEEEKSSCSSQIPQIKANKFQKTHSEKSFKKQQNKATRSQVGNGEELHKRNTPNRTNWVLPTPTLLMPRKKPQELSECHSWPLTQQLTRIAVMSKALPAWSKRMSLCCTVQHTPHWLVRTSTAATVSLLSLGPGSQTQQAESRIPSTWAFQIYKPIVFISWLILFGLNELPVGQSFQGWTTTCEWITQIIH